MAPLPQHIISSEFLSPGQDSGISTYLVVLNWSLPHATARLWHKASFRICADGGSNRLYDALPAMLGLSEHEVGQKRGAYVPQVIIGDLDSLRQDVREFYIGHGAEVIDMSDDQDTTDLMKCLNYLQQHVLPKGSTADQAAAAPAAEPAAASPAAVLPNHHILVLGAMGGRLDHTLSNLNTLYQYPHLNISLWGEGNLVRLVHRGSTVIRPQKGIEGPSCGLVPLGGPAIASSSGLRWNVDNTRMEISGLISTCNVIDADEIHVTTDRELLWMTAVDDR